jgi:large subunit ribosomal protein L13
MKSTQMIKECEVKRDWIVIDAEGKTFGRIITEVAVLLRGKHKPYYTPHVDCGDYVIIINATKAKFSGTKLDTKNYYTHSGYFGSTKAHKLADMLDETPEKLFKLATRGMLPKTTLGRHMLSKLKVYGGENHPHTAQVKGK